MRKTADHNKLLMHNNLPVTATTTNAVMAHNVKEAQEQQPQQPQRIEWSRSTILRFIGDYHQQRVLWDSNTKGYHIKQTKYEALKYLSVKYNTEIRSIRSKIKSLRSSFHREHGKVLNGQRKGVKYQPMWFAYEAIRFILDNNNNNNDVDGDAVAMANDDDDDDEEEKQSEKHTKVAKHFHTIRQQQNRRRGCGNFKKYSNDNDNNIQEQQQKQQQQHYHQQLTTMPSPAHNTITNDDDDFPLALGLFPRLAPAVAQATAAAAKPLNKLTATPISSSSTHKLDHQKPQSLQQQQKHELEKQKTFTDQQQQHQNYAHLLSLPLTTTITPAPAIAATATTHSDNHHEGNTKNNSNNTISNELLHQHQQQRLRVAVHTQQQHQRHNDGGYNVANSEYVSKKANNSNNYNKDFVMRNSNIKYYNNNNNNNNLPLHQYTDASNVTGNGANNNSSIDIAELYANMMREYLNAAAAAAVAATSGTPTTTNASLDVSIYPILTQHQQKQQFQAKLEDSSNSGSGNEDNNNNNNNNKNEVQHQQQYLKFNNLTNNSKFPICHNCGRRNFGNKSSSSSPSKSATTKTAPTYCIACNNNSADKQQQQVAAIDNLASLTMAVSATASGATSNDNSNKTSSNTTANQAGDLDVALPSTADYEENESQTCYHIRPEDVKTEIIENEASDLTTLMDSPLTYFNNSNRNNNNNNDEDDDDEEDDLVPNIYAQAHYHVRKYRKRKFPAAANAAGMSAPNAVGGHGRYRHLQQHSNYKLVSEIHNGDDDADKNAEDELKRHKVSAAAARQTADATNDDMDEYGVFGEYVAITIRKLRTFKSKIVVKHLINDLLYEAELGKYDHGMPSTKEPPQLYRTN